MAMITTPDPVPAEGLIKRMSEYTHKNPNRPQGYFTLAQIHYFVLKNKTFKISPMHTEWVKYNGRCYFPPHDYIVNSLLLSKEAEKRALKELDFKTFIEIPDNQRSDYHNLRKKIRKELREKNWQPPPRPSTEQLIEHAHLALKNYTKAIELDGEDALYQYGFACFLELYVEFLKTTDSEVIPKELHSILLEKSIESFYKAYTLSIKDTLKLKYLPGNSGSPPISLLAHKAGTGYLRMLNTLGLIPQDQERKIKDVKKNLKKIKRLKYKKGTLML